MKKALVIVLDSVGCGNAKDATLYGDEGADTLGHLFENVEGLELPSLGSLGLYELLGLEIAVERFPQSSAYRLDETAAGKDTTTGHWELMGYRLEEPFYTCQSFPPELLTEMERIAGSEFIGNKVASGTEIIRELGELHCASGKPILYTSADSVLQIAAHEEIYGLERLLCLCADVRALLNRKGWRIGRVIARPFVGNSADTFQRTSNRHDYSLTPERTVLNELVEAGVEVNGIGKISDIFAGSGIHVSYPTIDNEDGMQRITELWGQDTHQNRLIFANLVDFDSLYGHRRNPHGYAKCLMEFDLWLAGFLQAYKSDGLVILTADHGNDPFYKGTDHTREQVPCLVLKPESFDFKGEMALFSDVAKLLRCFFHQK